MVWGRSDDSSRETQRNIQQAEKVQMDTSWPWRRTDSRRHDPPKELRGSASSAKKTSKVHRLNLSTFIDRVLRVNYSKWKHKLKFPRMLRFSFTLFPQSLVHVLHYEATVCPQCSLCGWIETTTEREHNSSLFNFRMEHSHDKNRTSYAWRPKSDKGASLWPILTTVTQLQYHHC